MYETVQKFPTKFLSNQMVQIQIVVISQKCSASEPQPQPASRARVDSSVNTEQIAISLRFEYTATRRRLSRFPPATKIDLHEFGVCELEPVHCLYLVIGRVFPKRRDEASGCRLFSLVRCRERLENDPIATTPHVGAQSIQHSNWHAQCSCRLCNCRGTYGLLFQASNSNHTHSSLPPPLMAMFFLTRRAPLWLWYLILCARRLARARLCRDVSLTGRAGMGIFFYVRCYLKFACFQAISLSVFSVVICGNPHSALRCQPRRNRNVQQQ